jgi:hypothetical protein
VSGYGLVSTAVDGVPVSSFAIRADTFSIGAPAVPESAGQAAVAASKVYPLVVYGSKQTIDGKIFQPGVYIDSAFITKISASQVNTRGLTIKDDAGNVIFGSGTGLDWSLVGGDGKPADAATRNVFQGNWATNRAYAIGDIVLDTLGYGWSCVLAHTSSLTLGILVPVYSVGGANTNDYWSLYAVKGVDAVSVILPNITHILPATSDGTVGSYVGSGTTITVYDGTRVVVYDGTGTTDGTWKVVATPTNITVGTLVDSGSFLTVGDHSVVSAGTDTAFISYAITGKTFDGRAIDIKAQQSFTKSKAAVSPYNIELESTNGNQFRVGQNKTTLLIAHVFQGDAEITSSLSASQFRWRRVSITDSPPPNSDANWNALYVSGYKQISVDIDAVTSKATFFCDILSLT